MIHSFFSLRSLDQNRIEVFGTEGKLSLDFYRSTRVEFIAAHGADLVGQLAAIPGDVWRRGKKVMASKLNPSVLQFSWRAARRVRGSFERDRDAPRAI